MKDKEKKSLWRRIVDARMAYLFIAPLMIGLLVFCYFPPISGFIHGFYEWDGSGAATFTGFENYKNLFSDQVFLNSIPTMFYLLLPNLAKGIIAPLVMAELIFALKSQKLQSVTRVLILLPIVAPGVVGNLIWKNIYAADGLMTNLAQIFGAIPKEATIRWFDQQHIIFSLVFMGFPWIGGTAVLIYMSGLMNISGDVIEASRLDGCGTLRRIFVIDLPMLMGQIRYFLVFGIIGGLQDYGAQIVMTDGEPMVPGFYMYKQAFSFGNMGYACSIGTFLFFVIMIITLIGFRIMNAKFLNPGD